MAEVKAADDDAWLTVAGAQGSCYWTGIACVLPDRPPASEFAQGFEIGHLRGPDLWHVATALHAARRPGEIRFVTLDRKQRTVAVALGFQVAGPSRG